MSFFDHFTSLDTARWGTAVGGTGTVTVSDSNLVLATPVNLDAAIAYLKAPIDTAVAQQVWACAKGSNLSSTTGPQYIMGLFNHSGGPVVQSASLTLADRRVVSMWQTDNSLQFVYRAAGGASSPQWRTDNTWGVLSGLVINARTDDYYVVCLDMDPTLGMRFGCINDTYTTANTWDFNQGMRQFALTNWVAWSAIDTPQTDMYLTLGWPVTNQNRTGTNSIEWVAHDTGARLDAYCNARDSGGAWAVKHFLGYSPNRMMPEDRTTSAVSVGSGGAWDDAQVKPGSIVKDGSTYYLFYQGSGTGGSGKNQIGLATKSSPDGTFTKDTAAAGLIVPNVVGTAEDHVINPYVVKDEADSDANKRWKMLYAGFDGTDWLVHYATAPNAAGTWTKQGNIIAKGGSGAWDEHGHSGNFAFFHHGGTWVLYVAGNATGSSGTWSIGRFTGTSLTALTADANNPILAYGALAGIDARQNVSANINGRTVTMTDTTGFEVDMPVLVTASATNDNYSISRIRKITTNTSLELYHGLTGFPVAFPARVIGYSAGAFGFGDVFFYEGQWCFWVTPFSMSTADSPTYDAYHETTGLLRASSPVPTPAQLAWDWQGTPFIHTNQFGGARSLENPVTIHTPLTAYTPPRARPTSDISTGTWTVTPLWSKIDETVADDGDKIQSASTPSADVCEVALSALDDPVSSIDHIVRYRYGKDQAGGDVIDIQVDLVENTTVRATWTHTDISSTLTTAEQTLSAGEAGSITDYSALRLRFTASKI